MNEQERAQKAVLVQLPERDWRSYLLERFSSNDAALRKIAERQWAMLLLMFAAILTAFLELHR